MIDLPLFSYRGKPPYIKSSSTSMEAANRIEPSAGTLRAQVLACLKERGPQTDEQLMTSLSMEGNTLRPRRRELELAGYIAKTGETRLTKSGRKATVWKAL